VGAETPARHTARGDPGSDERGADRVTVEHVVDLRTVGVA
jgi:hypothetical protein